MTRSPRPDHPPQEPEATPPAPPQELTAEPSGTPPESTVEGVTALQAAVDSYKRNNPDESGEGE